MLIRRTPCASMGSIISFPLAPDTPGRPLGSEHHRDIRSVDVGVQKAHSLPGGGKSGGQVGRHHGLTDTSLSGTHRHDACILAQDASLRSRGWYYAGTSRSASGGDGGGRRFRRPRRLPGLRECDVDLHRADAIKRLHGAPSLPHEPPRIVRLNAEREVDVPGLTDLQPLDVPTLHHITAGRRVTNTGQGLEDTPTEIPRHSFRLPQGWGFKRLELP